MKRKGFTLVEIMIVVAIIALLAAIAIPNLLRARISAQEAAAAAALHTVATAEVQWRASHPSYSALSGLDDETPPYIDVTLAAGTKQGYVFATGGVSTTEFYATAVPQGSNARAYYVDESGVLCRSDAVTGTAVTAHKTAGNNCPGSYSEMQ
ncbi:MAG: prepilin-type N-terminal cleavage/methylation domain-containing protein [Candidatus Omnitrophica bacterium]|nr:prepilin-type N-terminal cleavage/methylation domain-containing protein [Candidatus Omnitrophota bacterium]